MKVTISLLADALEWAMQYVPEKIETAAGIGCKHCIGTVKRENRKGFVTDPVEHEPDCQWLHVKNILKALGRA